MLSIVLAFAREPVVRTAVDQGKLGELILGGGAFLTWASMIGAAVGVFLFGLGFAMAGLGVLRAMTAYAEKTDAKRREDAGLPSKIPGPLIRPSPRRL